jgi:hypothetical protein
MDAYDLADKLKKYWMALYPKNSGELPKSKQKIRVVINTEEGYREVVGVHIQEDMIELELDKE